MAKEENFAMSPFLRELFQGGLYKRSQGRVARQGTFAVLAITCALGVWRLSVLLESRGRAMQFAVPGVLLAIGLWVCFRVVNVPRFADFLIAVEAEMNKVSWPSRDVLFRSSFVVMFTIFFLAALLFLYDLLWSQLLILLGVTA
jgi:preprotein translocase subunit SecE